MSAVFPVASAGPAFLEPPPGRYSGRKPDLSIPPPHKPNGTSPGPMCGGCDEDSRVIPLPDTRPPILSSRKTRSVYPGPSSAVATPELGPGYLLAQIPG